jgi:hypothetical protein
MRRTVAPLAAVVLLVGVASGASLGATDETVIAVATRADVLNGDVRSVESLLASPGPDGISLREAIEATNNEPGTYAIRFAAGLRGRTIDVGSFMSPLTGGNVTVDGDIDGDGRADLTVRAGRGYSGPGLTIASGGNTLQSLRLEGFIAGVAVTLARVRGAFPTGQTFAGNTLSRLVIKGGPPGPGIYFAPTGLCEPRACATRNRWLDLRILDNTIDARGGITVYLFASVGDRLEGVTITRNTIRVPRRTRCVDPSGNAIDVVAGAGALDRENRISDVLISDNSVVGGAMTGVRVTAGQHGADSNVLERVRVVGNRIDLQPKRTASCMASEIVVSAGDYALLQRGKYANGNLMQDVEVSGNSLKGNEGMRVFAGGAGGARNTIRGLRVARNTMNVAGPFSGVNVNGAQGGVDRPTTAGSIADVLVDANRIAITKTGTDDLRAAFGGISVIAGDSSGLRAGVRTSKVERVRITNNVVGGALAGISLVGGFSFPGIEGPAIGNVLRNVVVSNNRILRPPMSSPSYERGIQGIRVAGGIGIARRNRVACVRVSGNRVAGVKDAVSVFANPAPSAARGASGNTASLTC